MGEQTNRRNNSTERLSDRANSAAFHLAEKHGYKWPGADAFAEMYEAARSVEHPLPSATDQPLGDEES